MKIALSTHPENYSQLLHRSLKLYRHAFLHIILLSFALSIVAFTPRIATLIVGQDFWSALPQFSPQRLWILLVNFVSLILFTSLLWRIRCVITDAHETFFDDLIMTLKKIPYILVAGLLQALLIVASNLVAYIVLYYLPPETNFLDLKVLLPIMLLFFLQFFLVMYVFFAFYFYLPIILVENEGIIRSLLKSASLVWKNWWRTVAVQITPWLIYLGVLIFVHLATKINVHIYFVETSPPTWASTSLHIIIFALFMPWAATTMLVQLRDLELRKIQKNPL